jgi:tRNA-splicing ligase RtcB
MIELHGKYASALITIDDVEAECITQIKEFLDNPLYAGCIIVIMPDTHGGKGAVIGFTCTLTPMGICVNVVGVDIACGINCWKINTPNRLPDLDQIIRNAVPLGTSQHETAIVTMEKDYPWELASNDVWHFIFMYNKKFGTEYDTQIIDYNWYKNLAAKLVSRGQTLEDFLKRVDKSIGSLGGGNHFVEISKDKEDQHYLIIHSGSRNIGKRIADYYQKLAESQEHNKGFCKDLAYLKRQDAIDYFVAMMFMKHFASMNRNVMGENISRKANLNIRDKIETIHNFIDDRDFTIRKGAIRSYVGEQMIIPFNMRDGSWIVEGKSNKTWNNSAPHGAGRIMSRGEAKRTLNLKDYERQMNDAGIYSTSICQETLDEAPDTYKKASVIQEAIGDTADIIRELKPVYNLKSSEDHFFGRKKRVKS